MKGQTMKKIIIISIIIVVTALGSLTTLTSPGDTTLSDEDIVAQKQEMSAKALTAWTADFPQTN